MCSSMYEANVMRTERAGQEQAVSAADVCEGCDL